MTIELRCTFERTGPVDRSALDALGRLFGDDCTATRSESDSWTIEVVSSAEFDKEAVEELIALVVRAARGCGLPLGTQQQTRAQGPETHEVDGSTTVSRRRVIQSSGSVSG